MITHPPLPDTSASANFVASMDLAVLSAAKSIHRRLHTSGAPAWDDLSENQRYELGKLATSAIEAALPAIGQAANNYIVETGAMVIEGLPKRNRRKSKAQIGFYKTGVQQSAQAISLVLTAYAAPEFKS